MSAEQQELADVNLKKVVVEGRRQGLDLLENGSPRLMQDWAEQLFADLLPIAHWLDDSMGTDLYAKAVKQYYVTLLNPALTLSGKMLAMQEAPAGEKVLSSLSEQYKAYFLQGDYQHYQQSEFEALALSSIAEQQAIEQQDELSFDAYIEEYFVEKPCI
jgi:glutamate--cysteine ligase